MRLHLALLTVLWIFQMTSAAAAQTDLYDDGPTDGTTNAWIINLGFTLSDSFTLSNPGHVSGLEFAAWLFPGDVLQSVEVSMTSDEFGGTVYFQQQVDISQSSCVLNQYSFNVCTETATFDGPSLDAGFYWLNLQNGVVNTGDPVYWDENRGPSEASENSLGTMPAESFTILGATGTTTTTGTTPEPGSLLLFGSGALGFIGILHRKLAR